MLNTLQLISTKTLIKFNFSAIQSTKSAIQSITASLLHQLLRKIEYILNIKSFYELRNNKKNLSEYFKNIDFVYLTDYADNASVKIILKKIYKNNIYCIFFHQNLKESAVN